MLCVTASGLLALSRFVLVRVCRWHRLFVDMVRQQQKEAADAAAAAAQDPFVKLGRAPNRPADLPVY